MLCLQLELIYYQFVSKQNESERFTLSESDCVIRYLGRNTEYIFDFVPFEQSCIPLGSQWTVSPMNLKLRKLPSPLTAGDPSWGFTLHVQQSVHSEGYRFNTMLQFCQWTQRDRGDVTYDGPDPRITATMPQDIVTSTPLRSLA